MFAQILDSPLWLILVVCVAHTVAMAPLPEDDPELSAAPAFVEEFNTNVNFRLPNNTRPIDYDVHLTTNVHLANFAFNGVVRIRLEVLERSRTIVVHQRQLRIINVALTNDMTGANIAVGPWQYDVVTEHVTVPLAAGATDLGVGERYVLAVTYEGTIRNDNFGVYRTSYTDQQGATRWLATTHFEATDARHAFPCYDEPARRAVFTIRITHGVNYIALSNMPTNGEPVRSADGLMATTSFQPTLPMPTYIVAFVVSDLAHITHTNQHGFVQRVFARPTAIETGRFGLRLADEMLDAFQSYLGIPFSLPKLDQVAVADFPIGAMENWGLVIYREDFLLYDPPVSRWTDRLNVARLVAHEYTHMWFGNHVTMSWWSYAWQKEGLATIYEYFAIDWVLPKWRAGDSFAFRVQQSAMVADSLGTSQSMTESVESPAAISAHFNFVTYSKSGSVLYMFLHAFTEATFRNGLVNHLNNGENSAANEQDFIAAFQTALDADTSTTTPPFANILTSWTRQPGYPILTVERDYNRPGLVTLRQQRYLSVNGSAPIDRTWWIPFNVATSAAPNFNTTHVTHWLPQGSTSGLYNLTSEQLTANNQWLLLNKRQTGYYRVQYDRRNYELLGAALRADHTVIHVGSRAQLIDDLFDFARTERIDYAQVFDLVRYLERDTDAQAWASALRGLELVDRLHSGSAAFAAYQRFVGPQLMARVFADVGARPPPPIPIESDDYEPLMRQQTRQQIVRLACQYGEQQCRRDTNAELRDYLARNATLPLHHDVRADVLCGGVRTATAEQFAQLRQRFRTEQEQRERNWLIDALACAPTRAQLQQLVESSIGNEDGWRSGAERYRVVFEAMTNHAADGVAVTMAHLTQNLHAAVLHYTAANVNRAVTRLATMVNNAERQELFDKLLLAVRINASIMSNNAIALAEQTVRNNMQWVERNQNTINQWIAQNSASTTALSTLLAAAMVAMRFLF